MIDIAGSVQCLLSHLENASLGLPHCTLQALCELCTQDRTTHFDASSSTADKRKGRAPHPGCRHSQQQLDALSDEAAHALVLRCDPNCHLSTPMLVLYLRLTGKPVTSGLSELWPALGPCGTLLPLTQVFLFCLLIFEFLIFFFLGLYVCSGRRLPKKWDIVCSMKQNSVWP